MRRNLRVVTVLSLALLAPAGIARAQTKGAAGAPGAHRPPPRPAPAYPPPPSLRPRPPPAPRHAPVPAPSPPRPRGRRAGARTRHRRPPPAPPPPAKLNLTATPPADKPAATTAPGATLSPNLPTMARQPHLCQAGGGAHRHHLRIRRRVEVRVPRLLPRATQGQLRPAVPTALPSTYNPMNPNPPPAGSTVPPYPPGAEPPVPGLRCTARAPPRQPVHDVGVHQHRSRAVDAAQLHLRQFARDGDRHHRQLLGHRRRVRHLQAQQGIDQAFLTLNSRRCSAISAR